MRYTKENIAELRQEFSIFEYKTDIDIVKPIIDLIIQNEFKNQISEEKEILLFNLLFLKSDIVFDIYCLIRKSKEKKITISICGVKEYFMPLLSNCSIIEHRGDFNITYFKNETKLKITAKHFLHRLYHRLSRLRQIKLKEFPIAVKTWCDVDIKLHSEVINNKDCFLFIYPFVANIKRGINHIQYVKQNFPNRFSLMGLPYSYIQWIKIILSTGHRRDINLVLYEYEGAINHIPQLRQFKVIYTSEEFMINNFLINKELQDQKVKIINIAHGLGLYCPYSCFDIFRTINSYQMRFYNKLSEIKRIEPIYDDPVAENDICINKKECSFVFIHQNYDDHTDKVKEAIYQDSLLKVLNKYSVDYITYIKFHPNTKNLSKSIVLKKYSNLREFRNDGNRKEIFLGTLSTSYYSFRDKGAYILIGENKSILKTIFGDNNIICTKDELKKLLCTH